ncbi:MAG: hypothetical protein NT087_04260 [Deltaproteobacteria bacterium]|nr:hypothetical protein [Deltaproteobacteria bacterium]MCX5875505.1 hypothetical protein [Deltaproteobacteria bacterium]
MKTILSLLFIFLLTSSANAGETKILYHQSRIAGPQISKDYYVKESLKKITTENPNLLQVKTYSTVTSPEGTTTYRATYQINCATQKSTIIAYWSSGYGNDNGTMVDGKWRDVASFEDAAALTKKICTK